MKLYTKVTFVFVLLLTGIITELSAQNLEFESVKRKDGSAFFAINNSTGQLSYMMDYGSNAGKWKKYGNLIRESGSKNLKLYALERSNGTAFFAFDGATGQVYFMLDHGSNAGKWKSFGGVLPKAAVGSFEFQAEQRTSGTVFFALNSKTGQLYYMADHGSSQGKWKIYGNQVPK